MTTPPIGATVLGYPRIGRRRELKKALERYWAGAIDLAELEDASAQVRADARRTMTQAGLDTIPVNTFSWYDQMLDTAVLLGAVPDRFAGLADDPAAAYFAMARGTDRVAPLEMTKWFDTNYHYLVPEISASTTFTLDAAKTLAELAEALADGVSARPVVIGPFTFLALAKAAAGSEPGFEPLSLLPALTEVYLELLAQLREAGAEWVQLDEPAAVRDLGEPEASALQQAYTSLAAGSERPALFVATYFAAPVEGLTALAAAGVEAVGLDLTAGPGTDPVGQALAGSTTELVLGAVDGRNIWRTDLPAAAAQIEHWSARLPVTGVSTSCSLLHVPYDAEEETELDPSLRAALAFADQKLAEVVTLRSGEVGSQPGHGPIPGRADPAVAQRLAGIGEQDRRRAPRVERVRAQAARLGLPPLPTTTIGSFPQTQEIRAARAGHRAGRLGDDDYAVQMKQEIARTVELQERLGLDVLVHGEPERNDMVQYFAEHLSGFATTALGWVQSYGSRCVRPPILYGDVSRPEPITVGWTTYAQSLSQRPVKGMLTGPVTILAWSFVRDDQPLRVTADQVALALRDEVSDLEAAGTAIVQVDEPALRELLPLRHADQEDYLRWSVGAFRLATGAAAPSTQIHTHLCYSEFGEVIEAIEGLDADVTSLEAARSGMEVLADVPDTFGAIGPGVYDIHSPRVPQRREIEDLLNAALRAVGPARLWVNPDCGLKTRDYAEVEPSLATMVAAARELRETLPSE